MRPASIFLGEWWRGAEFGLARAEEGSGEESARASAFFFEKIGGIHWTKFETILTKILKTNLDSVGQTIFLGEWIRPASADFPPAGEV